MLSGGVRVIESRTLEVTIIRWCEMKGQEEVAEEQVEVQITAAQTLVSDHRRRSLSVRGIPPQTQTVSLSLHLEK